MKKVAVVGGKGNMGRRYAMILEQYCECKALVVDVDTLETYLDLQSCDGIIISTPTLRHVDDIIEYSKFGKPILCEKPIAKSILRLKSLLSRDDIDLSMMNQYAFLNKGDNGHTEYNYFKTGGDGLMWDCINIIGLAKTSYDIKNDGLIWRCVLNGDTVSIADMDRAYIDNIKYWTMGWRNKEYILDAHLKVVKALGNG